jgi:hypothetical protein
MQPIIYKTVEHPKEVQLILDLQTANHYSNIAADTQRDQGFVTVRHEPDTLLRMNEEAPSVIAMGGEQLAGYCLMMPRSFGSQIRELVPMFEMLDDLSWRGAVLRDQRWFVMGQVCVSADFRGQGVFDGMYHHLREVYAAQFDFVITEIATRNTRSMRAHERVGFQTIHTYTEEDVVGEEWAVVLWEF